MMRAGGSACEAAGVLFATTSAVGHRVLIQAPGGFAYANRSAAAVPSLVLEASTAVLTRSLRQAAAARLSCYLAARRLRSRLTQNCRVR